MLPLPNAISTYSKKTGPDSPNTVLAVTDCFDFQLPVINSGIGTLSLTGAAAIPVPVKLVAVHSNPVHILDIEDPQDLRGLKKSVKAWKIVMGDRAGSTQIARNESLSSEKEVWQGRVEEDRMTKEQYFEVLRRVSSVVDDKLNPRPTSPLSIRTVQDQDRVTQGVVTYSVDPKGIYVEQLVSAASNVKMWAPPPKDFFAIPPFKGAGTALMQSLFKTAEEQDSPKVYLKPLTGSVAFYQRLGMDYDPKTDVFTRYTPPS